MTILLTDTDWDGLDVEQDVLEHAGLSLTLAPGGDRESLMGAIAEAEILLVCFANIDEELLGAAVRARAIIRFGGGTNNIDLDEARRLGIAVYNVPDASTEEVADHALLLMLSLIRQLMPQVDAIRRGDWAMPNLTPGRFRDTTLGLIGFGRTAQAFARRAMSLEMRIQYSDSSRTVPTSLASCRATNRDELLRTADVVSLHLPLTSETSNVIEATALDQMKPGALLINVARGGLVDTEDLVAALNAHQLGGAGLDVTAPEPLPAKHPLRFMDNVIVTPHTAYRSEEALIEVRRRVAQAARALSNGETPGTDLVGRVV